MIDWTDEARVNWGVMYPALKSFINNCVEEGDLEKLYDMLMGLEMEKGYA